MLIKLFECEYNDIYIIKWVKAVLDQVEQSGKLRILHHSTVMQYLTPGKKTTHIPYHYIMISQI